MTIPFVIDNQQHTMADVLNDLLRHHTGHSLDIATAYFNVGGWQLLRDGLNGLGNVRLLLGDEPEAGSDLGLREIGAKPVKGLIRDLARENFNETTLCLVEDLISFLRQEHVQVRLYKRGFLHAKCYLFYSGGAFERFTPVAAIVGSSNFTRPGLQTNKELNLAHRANLAVEEVEPDRVKAFLESTERKRLGQLSEAERVTAANVPGVLAINELAAWYDRQWEAARDFKEELIDLLDASKFGRKEYTPYQVYMKAIFEYFRDDLENETDTATSVRSVVELSEFQEDAVKKARKILASYDGVMVADSVLVDESHNFRNRNAQRYENLERILAANNRRGKISGERKKLMLLTATPINNTVFDLYNQINLFTGGDRSYFAAAGIGDLFRYFQLARRANQQQESGIALFNLLEEVVIRRTRPFIKEAYPNATIKVQPISWPERRLKTIRYDLEATYGGIYDKLVNRIEGLKLAPYRLETYKKQGIARDEFEEGREEALVGIFKSRYLKRFESSVDAFRISVRRALEFLETFESYILEGKVLNSASFQKAMRFLTREDEEDDATPTSLSEQLDAHTEARQYIETLPTLNAELYDLKRLHNDLRRDVNALREVWHDIETITPANDAKLARLKELLAGELKGQKVLLFTYYKDTARYVYKQLCSEDHAAAQWRVNAGDPNIRRMDSGVDTRERARLVAQFAPHANNKPELIGSDKEIDVMISTDVLSEGQNLQDCGVLSNYDLHWNPTRMVQRAGRIDRIGTSFETLWVLNMFPDEGLEKLLGLVESLSRKIASIDQSGFLDASILGEIVHPQNFNTLRRIEEEDGKVVEEQEQFVELVSSEFLLQNLRNLLDDRLRRMLEDLPDGIHSGLLRQSTKGVFFYFTAQRNVGTPLASVQPGTVDRNDQGAWHDRTTRPDTNVPSSREHYWRYIDLSDNKRGGHIEDNRYVITNLIQCQPDTPRIVPFDTQIDIFALQEKVIASIVQSSAEQVAVEEAPRLLDPIQQTIAAKKSLPQYKG